MADASFTQIHNDLQTLHFRQAVSLTMPVRSAGLLSSRRSSGSVRTEFVRRRPCALATVFAVALAASACDSTRMVSGIRDSFTSEEKLALQAPATHEKILAETPLYQDDELTAYVERVGQRIVSANPQTAHKTFRFYVLDGGESNAFAIPGGYVYIYRGLLILLSSEAQLASVLAHELAHLDAGHAASQARARGGSNVLGASAQAGSVVLGLLTFNPLLFMGGMLGGDAAAGTLTAVLSSGYSRQKEFEADRIGASYAAAAGYPPTGAVESIQALQQEMSWLDDLARRQGFEPHFTHGVFDSHPDNQARLGAVRALTSTLDVPERSGEGDYLRQINGVLYGSPRKLGVQRGQYFYDGYHQWVASVPRQWQLAQSLKDKAVYFSSPGSTTSITYASYELTSSMSPLDLVKTYVSGATLNGQEVRMSGRQVWRGTATLRRDEYEVCAWVEQRTGEERGVVMMGSQGPSKASSNAQTVVWPGTFDGLARSIRPMRSQERSLAKLPRVRVGIADGRKRYAQLAGNAPMGTESEAQIRVVNGHYPAGEARKGQRFKFIE